MNDIALTLRHGAAVPPAVPPVVPTTSRQRPPPESGAGRPLLSPPAHALASNLMVAALRDFGDFFACNNLFLISNDNRIALNARRRRHIAADYDLAWQELHALRMPNGNYHLPCAPYRAPDLADVPSKKRADARRRGELLFGMAADMRAQLARLLETPAASKLSM